MTSTRGPGHRPPFAATVTSEDGAVTATVATTGELRRLELSERGGRGELAATVPATIAAARRRAAEAPGAPPDPPVRVRVPVPAGEAS